MIKILVVGLSNIYGGIESYMKNAVDNIQKEKFLFDYINLSEKKLAFEDEFMKNNSTIIKVTNRKKDFRKYKKELINVYKNGKYDIIHIHIMSYEAFERIVWALKYTNARVIVHSHNAGFGSNAKLHTRLLHYLGKFILKSKKINKVACGNDAGKWMFEDDEFEILNNGVKYERFMFNEENRIRIRNKYNIKDNEIVIGHTGRLELQKNHEFLIDLFFEYNKINPDSKLLIVGDGSLKENLQQKVKLLNIEERVIFAGLASNVNEYYSAFDIFCLPSLFEGLSISLVEAQVNGLKCFCSTSIDKTSDISGNVEFYDLNDAPINWINKIKEKDIRRDEDILENINKEFFIENSIRKLEEYYNEKR